MTNAFQFDQHFSPKSHLLLERRKNKRRFLGDNIFLRGVDRIVTQVVGEEKDDGISLFCKK